MGGTLLRPLCLGGSLVGLISEVGLKLEGFDEVEDVMFWLCALWKTVASVPLSRGITSRDTGQ
jgi:hypothetical protein